VAYSFHGTASRCPAMWLRNRAVWVGCHLSRRIRCDSGIEKSILWIFAALASPMAGMVPRAGFSPAYRSNRLASVSAARRVAW
jgi:hypothetical protein